MLGNLALIRKSTHEIPMVADGIQDSIVAVVKRHVNESPDKVIYTYLDEHGYESSTFTFALLDLAARKVAATLQAQPYTLARH